MNTDPTVDKTSVYENHTGEKLSFAQIAFASAKDSDVKVEKVDDSSGYLLNGELYTPIKKSDTE